MKRKGCVMGLSILGVLLLVVIGVAAYVENRYEIAFRAPRVGNEAYASGSTAAKLVVRPPLAQRELLSLFLQGQDMPEWAVNAAVPEETTLLLDSDMLNAVTRVRFFINYARLGPVLRDAINQSGVVQSLEGINWEPAELVRKEKGVLLLDGTVPVPPEIAESVTAQWAGTRGYPPPRIEGEHAIELAIENRNGKAAAAIASLVAARPDLTGELDWLATLTETHNIATLRVFADFKDADTLKFTVAAEADTSANEKAVSSVNRYVGGAYVLLKMKLKELYDADFTGKTSIQGNTVHGDFTLSGVQKIRDAVMGAAPAP